jgi:hypothetical protein
MDPPVKSSDKTQGIVLAIDRKDRDREVEEPAPNPKAYPPVAKGEEA